MFIESVCRIYAKQQYKTVLTSCFMIKENKIPDRCVYMNRMIGTHVNVICDFFFTALLENKIKLMKGKGLRKHSLHEKTAASVFLKPFISSMNSFTTFKKHVIINIQIINTNLFLKYSRNYICQKYNWLFMNKKTLLYGINTTCL